MTDPRNIPPPRPWNQGDILFAEHLNDPGNAIEALRLSLGADVFELLTTRLVTFVQDHYGGPLRRFTYADTNGDYILCVPDEPGATAQVPVAKPSQFRTSLTSHGGFSITYTNDLERVVDGQTQRIVPALDVNDEIWAIAAPTKIKTVAPQTVDLPVNWLWVHTERTWAADV